MTQLVPAARTLGCILVLASPAAVASQEAAALIRRGDSAWQAGHQDSAATLYRAALAQDSLASSRAVFRVATTMAWASRTDSALALFARYERMEPRDWSGPLARARTQAWASRTSSALGTLDSLAAAHPTEREVVLLRAQVQSWAGDLASSGKGYGAWVAAHPDDDEARAALARTLAWDGRFDAAEREYQSLLPRLPAEAIKGLARVSSWRGDYETARRRWIDATVAYPADPECWVGLGQVERWMGRTRDAERSLTSALRIRPGYGDALSQLGWVHAELQPALLPLLSLTDDSDANRVTTLSLSGDMAPSWQGRLAGGVQLRQAVLGPTSGTSLTLRGGASWAPFGATWSVRAEAGLSLLQRSLAIGSPLVPGPGSQWLYALRVGGPLTPGLSIGASASGGAFDETAVLIARGLRTDGVDVEATLSLPARLTLTAGASWMRVGGGAVANSRNAVSAGLRYTLARGAWVGVQGRTFGFDTLARFDGYFSPQRFTLLEAAAHFELPKDLGWNLIADVGIGGQEIRVGTAPSSGKDAQRASIAIVYRHTPKTEVSAGLWIANVASPFAASSEYRAGGLTLRGRVGF